MEDYRETIWGISPRDRGWFQLITLIGGTAGSAFLTLLEISELAEGQAVSGTSRNVALGIGASFVASGFIAWALLQAKEMTMSIGDWIREANERRQQRRREQDYLRGYADAQEGKPPRPPGAAEKNGRDPSESSGNGHKGN